MRSTGLSELHWFVTSSVFLVESDVGRFSWALQERLHETTPPCVVWNNVPRRAYLSFPTLVGSGLSWFYFVWVDDGICWVGSDSSLLVCRDRLRPSFSPVGCFCHHGRLSSLMLRSLVTYWACGTPNSLQALRWTISILPPPPFGLEFTDKLEFMD